jgi:hypothetical protein
VQRGERGEFLNNLTGWVRVTVIGLENMVAVQGQVIPDREFALEAPVQVPQTNLMDLNRGFLAEFC